MDYKQKYKEALERAKDILKGYNPKEGSKATINYIFPELKESEDERIRKRIIQAIKIREKEMNEEWSDEIAWIEKQGNNLVENGYTNNKDVIEYAGNYSRAIWHKLMDNFKNIKDYHIGCNDVSDIVLNAIIDTYNWLEKQSEQKSSDTCDSLIIKSKEFPASEKQDFGYFNESAEKVEPKFKIGDWITYNHNPNLPPRKIIQITNEHYVFNNGNFEIKTLEADWHLWTIQDAKPGDILSNGKMIVIFKQFEDPSYRQHIIAYIGLDNFGRIQITDEHWELGIDKAKPATKEQCGLLFKKMKESGYEWNVEKKELKKIHAIDEDKAEMDYCFTKMMNGEKVSPTWTKEDKERYISCLQRLGTGNPDQPETINSKWFKEHVYPKINITDKELAQAMKTFLNK